MNQPIKQPRRQPDAATFVRRLITLLHRIAVAAGHKPTREELKKPGVVGNKVVGRIHALRKENAGLREDNERLEEERAKWVEKRPDHGALDPALELDDLDPVAPDPEPEPAEPDVIIDPMPEGKPEDAAAPFHAFADRSAEENKRVFFDDLRASRSGRELSPMPHGPDGGAWKTWGSPKKMGVVKNRDIQGGYMWATNLANMERKLYNADGSPKMIERQDKNGERHEYELVDDRTKTGFVNCRIAPDPDGKGATHMKWGHRGNGHHDFILIDCDIENVPKEHGDYEALSGSAIVRRCTYKDIHGNGHYTCNRWHPGGLHQYGPNNLPLIAPVVRLFEDSHMRDVGQGSWSGFQLTHFNPGTGKNPGTVVVKGSTFVGCFDFQKHQNTGQKIPLNENRNRFVRSIGGIMIYHYQWGLDGEGHPVEKFIVDEAAFDFTQASLPFIIASGCKDVEFEDSCFVARDSGPEFHQQHRAPKVVLDPKKIDGVPTAKTITLENVRAVHFDHLGQEKGSPVIEWMKADGTRGVFPLHCPGQRITIDCASGAVDMVDLAKTPEEADQFDLDAVVLLGDFEESAA